MPVIFLDPVCLIPPPPLPCTSQATRLSFVRRRNDLQGSGPMIGQKVSKPIGPPKALSLERKVLKPTKPSSSYPRGVEKALGRFCYLRKIHNQRPGVVCGGMRQEAPLFPYFISLVEPALIDRLYRKLNESRLPDSWI